MNGTIDASRPSTLRIAAQTCRRYWRMLAIGAMALVLGQAGLLLIPAVTGLYVDSIEAISGHFGGGRPDVFSNIINWTLSIGTDSTVGNAQTLYLVALAVLAVTACFFAFLKRLHLTGLSRRIEFDLRQSMFEHLQTLPLTYFTRMRSGDIVSRATSDVEGVRMMFGPAVMYIGEAAVMAPLTLIMMYSVSPALTAWALLPLGLLTVSTLWFSPRQRVHSEAAQERLGEVSARAQENFGGARVVKAFVRERFEADELDRLSRKLLDSQLAQSRNQAAYQAIIWTLNGAGILVFLYFGAQLMTMGPVEERLSLGRFLQFNFYYVLLYWPMINLGWVVLLVMRGMVSARRIDSILHEATDPSVVPPPGRVLAAASGVQGAIEFRGVSFAYEKGGKHILEDVSFTVATGRTLAIVGPVGAGKSSIAALLLRLHAPTHGAIRIDGKPVDDYRPDELRGIIGYVPQETFLFSESISDNITFGIDASDSAEVERAAVLAAIAPDVEEMPFRYDTLLGERGVNLSGGQKQRVAIARALVKRPRIVVLDDCLSAVDVKTEAAILASLKGEILGRTAIVIAQRVSAAAFADEIIVLNEGRIVERGTDRELRERNGLYAALARRQAVVEELTADGA